MEIFALKGYKVKVTEKTKNNGYQYDVNKVKEHLELNEIYTVEKTVVDNFNTDVYLQEIPGIRFNSVNFEGITKQPIELNQNHPDYAKFKRATWWNNH